jgi:hypothetical protein
MKFIEISHPEGGRFMVHIDHITSVHYRPASGDVKTRLGFDIEGRKTDLVLFGEEAEQTWQVLQKLKGESL